MIVNISENIIGLQVTKSHVPLHIYPIINGQFKGFDIDEDIEEEYVNYTYIGVLTENKFLSKLKPEYVIKHLGFSILDLRLKLYVGGHVWNIKNVIKNETVIQGKLLILKKGK